MTATLPDGVRVGLVETSSPAAITSTWETTWTVLASVPDGFYTVIFVGEDAGGLTGAGKSPLRVDGTPPPPPWLDSPRHPSGDVLWLGQDQ